MLNGHRLTANRAGLYLPPVKHTGSQSHTPAQVRQPVPVRPGLAQPKGNGLRGNASPAILPQHTSSLATLLTGLLLRVLPLAASLCRRLPIAGHSPG